MIIEGENETKKIARATGFPEWKIRRLKKNKRND